jgi:hypothetical protein
LDAKSVLYTSQGKSVPLYQTTGRQYDWQCNRTYVSRIRSRHKSPTGTNHVMPSWPMRRCRNGEVSAGVFNIVILGLAVRLVLFESLTAEVLAPATQFCKDESSQLRAGDRSESKSQIQHSTCPKGKGECKPRAGRSPHGNSRAVSLVCNCQISTWMFRHARFHAFLPHCTSSHQKEIVL